MSNSVREIREKLDDNNVRLGSLNQEVEALRQGLQQLNVAPPAPSASDGGAAPGAGDAAVATPAVPSAAVALGTSPQKLWDEAYADLVTADVTRIVEASPRRDDITATLREGGYAVVVDGPEQAVAVANAIAPEHLELMNADPESLLPLVRHAGAVFCGAYAPASVGDYLAGPSHVLPTFGSARFSSALRVDDFVKTMHAVTLDEAALARVAPHVVALAEAEGLDAHAESVRVRMAGR